MKEGSWPRKPRSLVVGLGLVFLLKGTDTFSRKHSDSCDIGSLVSY